jgi:hypothetical protein
MSTIACFFYAQLCVAFLRASSFDNVAVAIIEGRRQHTENDTSITSNTVALYREVFLSSKYVNKSLLIKCFIVSTCELFVWERQAELSIPTLQLTYSKNVGLQKVPFFRPPK